MASSSARAAREDAAQVAFDRIISHCSHQIPDLRSQGIPLPCLDSRWSATPSSHPNPTARRGHRVLPQRTAKTLQHRWKHEIQIALLRRRAAMTRAVLLNISARERWLLARLMDRATSHCFRPPPLDGGNDKYTITGTDTTTPSPASSPATAGSVSHLRGCLQPSRWTSTRWNSKIYLRTTASVLRQSPTLNLEREVCT